MTIKQCLHWFLLLLLVVFLAGFHIQESHQIPVTGASAKDWNPKAFWYYPWGKSGVHKGIDIFAKEGTPVIATTDGLVVYTGNINMGGNVVLMLGSKWRFYYYAHLQDITAHAGQWQYAGEAIGTVGSSGNAQGKPPHLHFAIHSLIPLLNQFDIRLPQPIQRMFYVDPDGFLTND